ncbi:MAG: FtsX-like permease family protein [bacterium]|nr:FtsX-like permease family protein [bacterium]
MSNIADKYVSERTKSRGISYIFSMQPLADIHLHSDLRYEVENPGNYQMIFIFASIGLLVLLIACINFINLATARSVNRAREVGVRKVVGGQRKQLILQFLSESFMVVILSIFAAILLIGNIIPLFNSLLDTHFNFADFFQPHMIMIMLALLLFAGFVAGVYPAFFLSAYKPASVLKASRGSGSAKSPLRRALVLFQFSISIILIILTINVFKQLDYMKHKHLGFDKEQKLVVQFRGGMSIDKNYESVKEKFLKHSGILNASVSTGLPGGWMNNFSVMLVGEENDMNQGMYHVYYDPDFVPNFNIKMLAGRAFDKEMGTDEGKTCLINRAATKALGFSTPGEALGKIIKSGHGSKELRVIGVTGDYHFRGLQHKIEPLLMAWRPNRFANMTLTLKGDDPAKTLAFVKNTWAALYPGYPFNYYFLDENFNKQYNAEEQSSQLFSIFAILGQMIACLGLLGLAAFTTQQRTKEIGIRKVLGASVSNITFLISKEFLKWVLWANVIAWPLGYLVINQWLGGFAYRTGIGFQSFLFASLLTLFIAILTVSYKSLRAAISNPVKSLRFE